MAEIFVCPKGALTKKQIAALDAVGVVVVATDQPEQCRFIRATQEVTGTDMLWAALDALNSGTYSGTEAQRTKFSKNLLDVVLASKSRAHAADAPAGKA